MATTMKTCNRLVALIAVMASFACSKDDGVWTDEVYMLVAPHYVEVPSFLGTHRNKSLSVKIESENEGWFPLYASIQEFEYEEGFSYRLFVRRSSVPDPPQDGSSVEYTLIRIVEKKKETKD